ACVLQNLLCPFVTSTSLGFCCTLIAHCSLLPSPPRRSTLFPYTTLFRSKWPIREGNPLKNQTCEQGEASLICPRRSRRTFKLASDRKSTRLNSSHSQISYAVFCLKKKKKRAAAAAAYLTKNS